MEVQQYNRSVESVTKPPKLEVHAYCPPPEGGPGDGGTAVKPSEESVIKPPKLEVPYILSSS